MDEVPDQLGATKQRLAHLFQSPPHQHAAATMGMWLFIASEVMLFGGLFCLYTVFRIVHPELFAYGSRFLDLGWGAISTAVLIISSVMMAMAVRSARIGHQLHTVLFLGLTLICGVDFLGVTYIEYRDLVHENLVGGQRFYEPTPHGPDLPVLPDALPPIELSPGVAAEGKSRYLTTCAACHGRGGEGLVNFGRPLTTSSFVAGLDDQEMLEFLRSGRSIDDPLNTTGIAMAPRGGNPLMTDQDLAHIVAFVRTLHGGTNESDDVGMHEDDHAAAIIEYGPVVDPRFDPQRPPNAHLFFSIYFLMTGIHALHVLAGMAAIIWSMVHARGGRFRGRHFTLLGLGGLYWHFVDIIWLLIFSLLYLIG